jgi:hypothetical protein
METRLKVVKDAKPIVGGPVMRPERNRAFVSVLCFLEFAEVAVLDTRMGVDNKVKFRIDIKLKQAL